MICIAIDGPAGSGKSTVSKLVAKKMGYTSVDTGALYRTIAYYLKINNISYDSEKSIEPALKNIHISGYKEDEKFIITLNGENIDSKIRFDDIAMISSKISKFQKVRDFLIDIQRTLAKNNNVVMDGRDIGTVVVPDAKVKIFLTASLEIRSMRRYYQMRRTLSYEKIFLDLKNRDIEDIQRKISPLKRAEDAVYFDNSKCTLQETVDKICKIAKEKINS